jgi:hypothetical protein
MLLQKGDHTINSWRIKWVNYQLTYRKNKI